MSDKVTAMLRTVLVVLLVLALLVVALPLAMPGMGMGMGDSAPCPECDAVGGSFFMAMCAAILALAFALSISSARGSFRVRTPSFITQVLVTGLDRPPRAA